MTALDRPVAVTFFKSAAATEKREEAYSPHALAERIRVVTAARKDLLPWLKLARFGTARTNRGSLRQDANVLAITGIEADYDGGTVTVDDAGGRLVQQGVAAILYTSPSHTLQKPRWRVLCPLSEEMPPGRHSAMLGRLNGLLGGVLARESFVLSQSYYYGSVNHSPSHRVELIDGTPIDLHDDLDPIWTGPSKAPASDPATIATSGDERDLAELVRRIVTGVELHTPLCVVAARLIGRSVPASTVTELLRGLMLAYPDHARDARWQQRYDDIPRVIDSAVQKFAPAADRRKQATRAVAAVAGRLIRERRPSADVRSKVLEEAERQNIDAARAENILAWIAEREVARRGGPHAAA